MILTIYTRYDKIFYHNQRRGNMKQKFDEPEIKIQLFDIEIMMIPPSDDDPYDPVPDPFGS